MFLISVGPLYMAPVLLVIKVTPARAWQGGDETAGWGRGVWGLGFRVQGSEFRVQGSWFRVEG